MQQLLYVGKNKLRWSELEPPVVQAPTDALVRPFVVARCDVETAFFRHDLSPLLRLGVATHLLAPSVLDGFGKHPFKGPFPVGHECIAQVTAVGEGVTTRRVGDVVIVPFQVSCGSCRLCSRGHTAHCETDRPSAISAFGGFADPTRAWGGMLSDSLRVPFADHLLVPMPETLDPIAFASASDNMVDAYRAVAPQLEKEPGAPVLVVGGRARSVGLYSVAIARALGAVEVVYVDWDKDRLRTAEALGARALDAHYTRLCRAPEMAGHFPIAVEASGKQAGLQLAVSALAVCGTCTVVAFHWGKSTPLPLWDMYARNVNIQTGMVDARTVLPKLLALGASGRLDVRPIISSVASWSDAPVALLQASTKVVIERSRLP